MAVRLRNQRYPLQTLNLTSQTWVSLLDLASEYGWSPRGTLCEDWLDLIQLSGYFLNEWPHWETENSSDSRRLVIIEDALNLADALELAFVEYEPVRVPASYFFFETKDAFLTYRPSIGAIGAAIQLCQMGAFWIEQYQHFHQGRGEV